MVASLRSHTMYSKHKRMRHVSRGRASQDVWPRRLGQAEEALPARMFSKSRALLRRYVARADLRARSVHFERFFTIAEHLCTLKARRSAETWRVVRRVWEVGFYNSGSGGAIDVCPHMAIAPLWERGRLRLAVHIFVRRRARTWAFA